MGYVQLTYRRLPGPVKALLWIAPMALAWLAGVSWPPWW
jgi:hypothetical protein